MEPVIWGLTAFFMLVGVAGTIIPGVPGAPIILLAAVMHKFFLPQFVSWWVLAVLAVMAVTAVALEMACTVGGAKWYGATTWGLLGAGVGALIGLIVGPLGLLVGAILGAILGELVFAKKPLAEAAKAGLGAGLGLLASSVGRLGIAVTMIAIFAVACFV